MRGRFAVFNPWIHGSLKESLQHLDFIDADP